MNIKTIAQMAEKDILLYLESTGGIIAISTETGLSWGASGGQTGHGLQSFIKEVNRCKSAPERMLANTLLGTMSAKLAQAEKDLVQSCIDNGIEKAVMRSEDGELWLLYRDSEGLKTVKFLDLF